MKQEVDSENLSRGRGCQNYQVVDL